MLYAFLHPLFVKPIVVKAYVLSLKCFEKKEDVENVLHEIVVWSLSGFCCYVS
jgi:hypothetical protein